MFAVVIDDWKPVAPIEGNGDPYGFQWIWAQGVAPTIYMGTSGLDVWKGESPKGQKQLSLNM